MMCTNELSTTENNIIPPIQGFGKAQASIDVPSPEIQKKRSKKTYINTMCVKANIFIIFLLC